MMDLVSWDDHSIPNWMEIHKSHVPNHQAVSGFEETLQLVLGGRCVKLFYGEAKKRRGQT